MRIRPLHIALIVVAAGAAYSIVSVIASFAEIKSVSEQVTAASARAQRLRPAEPVVPLEPARAEAEPSNERGLPGSIEPIDRPDAVLEPGAADDRLDVGADEVDIEATQEEERYNAKRGPHDDSAVSELDGSELRFPQPEDGDEDPALIDPADAAGAAPSDDGADTGATGADQP